MEISVTDVIKLIQQFMAENHLNASLKALQEESEISLNSVSSLNEFSALVLDGRWDLVFSKIVSWKIPLDLQFDLYEHVLIELVEANEMAAAKAIKHSTVINEHMKSNFPQRYSRIESIISKVSPISTVFPSWSKNTGRERIEKRIIIIFSNM
jgi:WD40 repeat-containing protein SMU1